MENGKLNTKYESRYKRSIRKKYKKLRNAKNISREELSLQLGFDNSYISKLEKKRVNITIDKIEKLAKYFEVEVSDLFKD